MNNVNLIGRTTKEMDLRYTQTGKAVANFTLAVRRSFPNQDGQYETDFINCVAWGKQAETLVQYVKKGNRLGVTGRISTRSYKADNGQNIYVTEVIVDGFDLLEPKKETSSQTDHPAQTTTSETLFEDNALDPFSQPDAYPTTNLPF